MISLPQLSTNQYGVIGTLVVLATQFVVYLQSHVNGQKIHEMHLTMNGRLSELLTAVRAQAHAEGRAEGVQAQIAKDNPKPIPEG
jgi:hypothetical protein